MASELGPGQIPVYTLEAVNALVPRLNAICGEQLLRRSEIEARLSDLESTLGKAPESLAADEADSADVARMKRELVERVEEYQKGWTPLEEMGAVLKDARMGLVDFYGRVDGKLVWLCWKYGEEECTHYHALDEGFSGRREIETSMKTRLLN
jgi:hypothetical protein